jgi:hypothetical protein
MKNETGPLRSANEPVDIRLYLIVKCVRDQLPAGFDFAVAFAAVNRFALTGFEWNLGLFAAFCTNCRIHLSGAGVGSTGVSEPITAAALAAGGAALGFVGITLGSEELLLTGGE